MTLRASCCRDRDAQLCTSTYKRLKGLFAACNIPLRLAWTLISDFA